MNLPSAQPVQYFDEGTRLISYCPLCQSSYTAQETRVLGEKDDSHLLHIRCGNCENAILALVLISAAGVNSIGLATDLCFEEVNQFKGADAVSTDDVIDCHDLLQHEDEFFAQLALA